MDYIKIPSYDITNYIFKKDFLKLKNIVLDPFSGMSTLR